VQQCQQIVDRDLADPLLRSERIGERERGVDRIAIAAADPLAVHVSGVGELVHDSVGGAFGDPNRLPDLA
jgi:hypothetical protein